MPDQFGEGRREPKITRRQLPRAIGVPIAALAVLPEDADAAEKIRIRRTPLQIAFVSQLKEKKPISIDAATASRIRSAWADSYGGRLNKKHVASALDRISPYEVAMRAEFKKVGIGEEYMYLSIVETWFRLNAISPAKAVGPFQFLAATARQYGLTVNDTEDERKDPVKSAEACAKYLKKLHNHFAPPRAQSDDDAWKLAISTYNGSFAYQYAERNGRQKLSYEGFLAFLAERLQKRLQDPNAEKTYVVVPDDSLWGIAKRYSVAVEDLVKENNLKSETIQPRQVLKIPKLDPDAAKRYRVRRGDTLGKIAEHMGTSVKSLKEINAMKDDRIVAGKFLVIPKDAKNVDELQIRSALSLVRGLTENAEYLLKFEGLIGAMRKEKMGMFK